MAIWYADDGNAELELDVDSGLEAAQEYVADGDWGEITETIWIDVRVWQLDDDGERINEDMHTITIDPPEPECTSEDGHDWTSPYELLGGLKENPGVFGHGGGAIVKEVCRHCGCLRTTDTWAQRMDTGEQGLTSVEYDPDFTTQEHDA